MGSLRGVVGVEVQQVVHFGAALVGSEGPVQELTQKCQQLPVCIALLYRF